MVRIVEGVKILAMKKAISYDQIKQFDKTLDNPQAQSAINAATNNGLFSAAQVNRNGRQVPKKFSIEVETSDVTDQKRSGRCWLFATLNDLREEASKKLKVENFEFSQNYCSFWDRFEKANLYLENAIRLADRPRTDRLWQELMLETPEDGGWVSYAGYIINKYGLVPKEIMPETVNSNNTAGVNSLLERLLIKDAVELRELTNGKGEEVARTRKEKMLSEVYRLLATAFGRPPMMFSWSYVDKKKDYHELKDITPLEFKRRVVRPVNYVTLISNEALEFNKLYKRPLNTTRTNMVGKNPVFLNLPFKKLRQIVVAQLKDKKTVVFDCKISNIDSRSSDGFLTLDAYDFQSLTGIDFAMPKLVATKAFYNYADHEMLLTGVTLDDKEQPTWWKVENSWGSKNEFNKGYYTMSNDWWERYGYSISLPKRDLSDDIKALFKQKPITKKVWELL